jgi:hypothetical protein
MKIIPFVAAGLLLAATALADVPGLEVKGPYASVKTNKDGSREYFSRTRDMRTITKQTKGADGTLRLTTVYRLSPQGNPLTCDIFDGKGQRLFKSRYGYDPKPGLTFGKLVEEQMFDARVKRADAGGNEIPVRRFLYTYDARGKAAEEVYGPSALEFDPFDGQGAPVAPKQANPRAKPVGGQ